MPVVTRLFDNRRTDLMADPAATAAHNAAHDQTMQAVAGWLALHAIPPEHRARIDLSGAPEGSVNNSMTMPLPLEISHVYPDYDSSMKTEELGRQANARALQEALARLSGRDVFLGDGTPVWIQEKMLAGEATSSGKNPILVEGVSPRDREDIREPTLLIEDLVPGQAATTRYGETAGTTLTTEGQSFTSRARTLESTPARPAFGGGAKLGLTPEFVEFFSSPALHAQLQASQAAMRTAADTPLAVTGRGR